MGEKLRNIYTKIVNLPFITIQKNEVTISSLVKVTMGVARLCQPLPNT
ncbi:hypothetical protein DSUL_60088 [Desulfovibrionales bacterium]